MPAHAIAHCGEKADAYYATYDQAGRPINIGQTETAWHYSTRGINVFIPDLA